MDTKTLARDAAAGAAAGLAAAFLMNCFQILWGKASAALSSDEETDDGGGDGEPATVKAVEKFQGMVTGRPVPEEEKQVAGNLLHYGFGAALGIVYALGARREPELRAGFGTIYGGAVAILFDELAVPAAGLSPPPTEAPAWSHFYGLLSHLVFGAALEASLRTAEAALER